jgi:hypothetical protein
VWRGGRFLGRRRCGSLVRPLGEAPPARRLVRSVRTPYSAGFVRRRHWRGVAVLRRGILRVGAQGPPYRRPSSAAAGADRLQGSSSPRPLCRVCAPATCLNVIGAWWAGAASPSSCLCGLACSDALLPDWPAHVTPPSRPPRWPRLLLAIIGHLRLVDHA